VYLPLIEAGYNPRALSAAGAAGLWQLMDVTARSLGLEVSLVVDERRDPVRSTEAALRYIRELNGRFGSWFLTLAAYNSGPSRVERILRREAPDRPLTDALFWELRGPLPRETEEFLPKLIAAARLAGTEGEGEFGGVEGEPPFLYEEVEVNGAVSLDVVARAAEASREEVKRLNPQFPRGYTPARAASQVRIPHGRGDAFRANFPRIPSSERLSLVEHRVASGETFTHIALRYGVPVGEVTGANPDVRPRRLQIGQVIVVPLAPSAERAEPDRVETRVSARPRPRTPAEDPPRPLARVESSASPDASGVKHTIRTGESLWVIARRYGVSTGDLRRWNDLAEGSLIYPGQELSLPIAPPRFHTVRRGDTVSGIAERFGVRTSDLLRWNGLSRQSIIHPGDQVRVGGGAP
jgi:membrane-bound lytic murein transglycosylase D